MDDFIPDDFSPDDVGNGDDFTPDTGSAGPPNWSAAVNSFIDAPYGNKLAGMGLQAQRGIQDMFNRGGEKLSEGLAGPGVRPISNVIPGVPTFLPILRNAKPNEPAIRTSPEVAAGVGTATAMLPDLASSFTPSMAGKGAVEAAVPLARRAMGFQKSLLKTPFARGQATQAAKTALEENIIPMLGNPQKALDRASILSAKSGERIGSVLKNTKVDLKEAINSLEGLRGEITQGVKGGVYQAANNAIDTVQESILELVESGSKLTGETLSKIKNRLGNSINYLSDLASQTENKAMVGNLANTVRRAVKAALSPSEFSEFLNDQKLYSAAQLMKKGLNNEVAGQMGNAAVSLPSSIFAAGELAAGNPMRAAATVGLTEAVKRRGAGATARMLQDFPRASRAIPAAGVRTTREIPENPPDTGEPMMNSNEWKLNGLGRMLTEDIAMKFMDMARNNKEIARRLATEYGWVIPK